MQPIEIGVIGGSGVYKLDEVEIIEERYVKTPLGIPIDKVVIGKVGGRLAAFIPRHGIGHRRSPSEVDYRANIYALKLLGVKKIIAVSAVGSLKEEIRPTDFVLPNQIIDRTKNRTTSFFENGIVGHISFADPFCEVTRAQVAGIINDYFKANFPEKRLFTEETYVCMEGPQFSTRAESNLYRSWGAGVIGMTAIPEAKLAREAEMSYVTIAMATDYDCWKEEEEEVGVSMVLQHMQENNRTINGLLPLIIEQLDTENCPHENAAEFAVMTAREHISAPAMKKLKPLYGKYWK